MYCPQGIISEVANEKSKQFCFATGYRKILFISENHIYHFEIPKNKNYEKLSNIPIKLIQSKNIWNQKEPVKKTGFYFKKYLKKNLYHKLDQAKINIALFSNVLWDAKIHFDGSIFEDPISWVKSTFEKSKDLENINFILRVTQENKKGLLNLEYLL